MRYAVTLMNSKGKEMPVPDSKPQASLGLAIAYAHKQLSAVNNTRASALVKELNPDGTAKVVKVVNLNDRLTSPLK